MTLLQALVLGIVQGVTEYIPVSSSAHLVLVPWLLGWPEAGFVFDVLVQWGTLVAVILYFWRDLTMLIAAALQGLATGRPLATADARLAWLIVVGSLPAGVLGLLFKEDFKRVFSAQTSVAALLLVTGLLLVLSERLGTRTRPLSTLTWLDAFIVGLAQALSILPGISRSGATMAAGLGRHLDREAAARFSFLLSIPALLGAGIVALKDLADMGNVLIALPVLATGFIAAAITGYLCIAALLAYLRRRSLTVFAVYCWLFGGLSLLIALLQLR